MKFQRQFRRERLTGCSYADENGGQVKRPCRGDDEHRNVTTREKHNDDERVSASLFVSFMQTARQYLPVQQATQKHGKFWSNNCNNHWCKQIGDREDSIDDSKAVKWGQ